MSTKKPNVLKTPWRNDAPDRDECVCIYDRTGEEILVCQLEHAANKAAAERRMWRGVLRTEAEILELERLRREAFPELYN
jgi:hypothetical protein